ncbi:MAG: threonine-phosphate decarboxylase, partial [Candidatus Electrothrix sp. AR4]|nr:threonine-phosphate decarboxylase [Candidatus Electrothrix sp. AR4]
MMSGQSGHGGNMTELAARLDCASEDLLDFSANINPLGPPDYLWNILAARMPDIVHYPDPEATELIHAIAEQYRLQTEQIVVGNGTSDLLYATLRALVVDRIKRAVILVPAYIDYRHACAQAGVEITALPLSAQDGFQPDLEQLSDYVRPDDLVILGQPNNPTGRMNDREELLRLADQHPDVLFLLDEAFAGFVDGYTSLAGCRDNIITLCSLTKLFAIPGLRLGFLAASETICRRINQQVAPWSVNSLAQAVGAAMIGDVEYVTESRELVSRNRCWLQRELGQILSLQVVEGTADFILVQLVDTMIGQLTAAELADRLLHEAKIAIRVCENYEGLDEKYFRVAVRGQEENRRLVTALRTVLEPAGSKSGNPKPGGKK